MDEGTDAPKASAGPAQSVSPQESVSEAPAASTAFSPPGSPDLPRPSNLGIWALVLACLGLVGILPIIGSVLGFVLGRVALRHNDSRPLRGGRGLAVAAVVVSLVTLIALAAAVAVYALLAAFVEL